MRAGSLVVGQRGLTLMWELGCTFLAKKSSLSSSSAWHGSFWIAPLLEHKDLENNGKCVLRRAYLSF